MMDGVLIVRKEKEFTSHDVVAKLRGILHMKKIGHTGTLDPEAEGVLPVVLGKATRLVDLLTEKEKTYEALLRLGIETDTQDMTGTILKELPVQAAEEEVREAVQSFLGEQQQIPPMYSALKVNGKKLYELAREGKTVERKPRTVNFYEICILDMKLPYVKLSVTCSKGTYIRTLCHDIGQKLGCGGCMEKLLRTRSGQFALSDSLTLDEIRELHEQDALAGHLIGIQEILGEYPAVYGKAAADRLLRNGNPVSSMLVKNEHREGWIRMYTSEKDFIGIYQWHPASEAYRPVKMFL
nr:tRNA pseudouridine(55) synthase TruB [uncultured Blautia sp.]